MADNKPKIETFIQVNAQHLAVLLGYPGATVTHVKEVDYGKAFRMRLMGVYEVKPLQAQWVDETEEAS